LQLVLFVDHAKAQTGVATIQVDEQLVQRAAGRFDLR